MHSMTDVKEEVFTVEDHPLLSMTEVNEEVPRSIKNPSINATSSSMATTMENDMTCPLIHLPSPSATPARRRRKPMIDFGFVEVAALHNTMC